jgi:hypothetical protein
VTGASVPTGQWDHRYAGLADEAPYGDDLTYRLGARFFRDCALVEDWGCGMGWLRKFLPPDRYRGVDGSHTPFASEIVDLASYRSTAEAIFLRHVLEHNYRWEDILRNAVSSFRRKLVIVVFTPFSDTTHEHAHCPDIGVPDISFRESDLTTHFAGLIWRAATYRTDTHYGAERMFFVRR